MKTINQAFQDFLQEQEIRLKPRTYKDYKNTIDLFQACLDGYAPGYLDDIDYSLYEREDKDYCDVFGPEKITSGEISEFLDYFLIKKVMAGKDFMQRCSSIMNKFVKWMGENNYIQHDEALSTKERINELKEDLPIVTELSDLIFEHAQANSDIEAIEYEEGTLSVAKVEPKKLWFNSLDNKYLIGPVIVSKEISTKCKLVLVLPWY